MEVRNKFKGLDLIDRVPEELWMEVHDIVQEAGIKTIPKIKKCKKAKWLSEEDLQIAVNRSERKRKKERYTHLNAEIQRLGAACGSDHELLTAKFKLKLKKVGKSTRPLRYDLNQIPYDYTVEVRNRFKGLDLIDRMPDELWTEVPDIVQETEIKTIPNEKKCKKAKWLSEDALQIAVNRREAKSKGKKERYTHWNTLSQRIARRDKKGLG